MLTQQSLTNTKNTVNGDLQGRGDCLQKALRATGQHNFKKRGKLERHLGDSRLLHNIAFNLKAKT